MSRKFCLSVALFSFTIVGMQGAVAQDSVTTTTRKTVIESHTKPGSASSVTTVEQSGVMGFKSSNKVNYKYKERLKTYAEQIDMGQTKGWLTAEEVSQFKTELARLNALEAEVSGKGYQKAQVDDLEKQVTKFNMDLTAAANKKPATASGTRPLVTTTAAPAAKKATSAAGDKKTAKSAPAKTVTTTAKTTKR